MSIKYHMFYIKNDKKYELYAYTDDKEMSNRFMKERKMDIFKHIKKDMNKDDIHYLAEYHQKKMLELTSFETKNDEYEMCEIELVVTTEEKFSTMAYSTMTIHQLLYQYAWDPFEMYKSKYIKALYKLLYVHVNEYISKDERSSNGYRYIDSMKEDALGCFVRSYGYTLRK